MNGLRYLTLCLLGPLFLQSLVANASGVQDNDVLTQSKPAVEDSNVALGNSQQSLAPILAPIRINADSSEEGCPISLLTNDLHRYLLQFFSHPRDMARLSMACRAMRQNVGRLPWAPAKFGPLIDAMIDPDCLSSVSQCRLTFIISNNFDSVLGLKDFVASYGPIDAALINNLTGVGDSAYFRFYAVLREQIQNPTKPNYAKESDDPWFLLNSWTTKPWIPVMGGTWDPAEYLKLLAIRFLPRGFFRTQAEAKISCLNLSGHDLKTLPGSLSLASNLRKLVLVGNDLQEFPKVVARLITLVSLDLQGNRLSSLPESLGCLNNLITLVLSNNRISKLPDSIGNLQQLEQLDVCHNRLVHLPDSIGDLKLLRCVVISDNQLVSLPDSIGDLQALMSLYASNNKLESLPSSIVGCNNLGYLDLDQNDFIEFPKEILKLTSLQDLNYAQNRLNSLPDGLVSLSRLNGLNLSKNRLLSIPAELALIRDLNLLNVSSNRLTSIPDSLRDAASGNERRLLLLSKDNPCEDGNFRPGLCGSGNGC